LIAFLFLFADNYVQTRLCSASSSDGMVYVWEFTYPARASQPDRTALNKPDKCRYLDPARREEEEEQHLLTLARTLYHPGVYCVQLSCDLGCIMTGSRWRPHRCCCNVDPSSSLIQNDCVALMQTSRCGSWAPGGR
jgi:hypothetical protein